MQMKEVPQSVLDQIQKIANLKEGAEAVGNHKEAEVAASMMLKLLLKWNLDMEIVSASQIAKKANIEEVKFTTEQDKRETEWVSKLYVAVASNYMCTIFNYDTYVRIIGHAENVSFVAYACEQLVSKIRIGEKLSWQRYNYEHPYGEKRGTYRRGFFVGAVTGIWHRLYDEMQEAKVVKEKNPYAVMIIKKEDELNEYLYEKGYKMRPPTAEQERKMQERRQRESDEFAKKWNAMTDKEKAAWEKKNNRKIGKSRKGPKETKSKAGMDHGYKAGRAMNINKGIAYTEPKTQIN